ncbi:hypothetical protein, partial [Enterococcus faecium]|uniref:hypothetical protein n=1 Tax=Enterococcus faecium TaxID=1352 RepID=UPI0030C84245
MKKRHFYRKSGEAHLIRSLSTCIRWLFAGKKLTISYQMQLSSTAQANKEINNNGTLDFGFGVSTKKVSV